MQLIASKYNSYIVICIWNTAIVQTSQPPSDWLHAGVPFVEQPLWGFKKIIIIAMLIKLKPICFT